MTSDKGEGFLPFIHFNARLLLGLIKICLIPRLRTQVLLCSRDGYRKLKYLVALSSQKEQWLMF